MILNMRENAALEGHYLSGLLIDNVPIITFESHFSLCGLEANLSPTKAPTHHSAPISHISKCHRTAFEHDEEYNMHSAERFALTRPQEISPPQPTHSLPIYNSSETPQRLVLCFCFFFFFVVLVSFFSFFASTLSSLTSELIISNLCGAPLTRDAGISSGLACSLPGLQIDGEKPGDQ